MLVVLTAAVGSAVKIYITGERAAAVGRYHSELALAQQDSVKVDSWEGIVRQGDTAYLLMSIREDNAYLKDFLKNFKTPALVLALLTDNSRGDHPHSIDVTAATLHFANGTSTPVLDQRQIVQSAVADHATIAAALPIPIPVGPHEQHWGRIIFIPLDANIRLLTAVTLKIDGKDVKITGGYHSASEKLQTFIYEEQQRRNAQPRFPEPPK